MRPEVHIKDDLDRTVERTSDLNPQEQKFLTLYRELSESDKGYLMRVAEALTLTKTSSVK